MSAEASTSGATASESGGGGVAAAGGRIGVLNQSFEHAGYFLGPIALSGDLARLNEQARRGPDEEESERRPEGGRHQVTLPSGP